MALKKLLLKNESGFSLIEILIVMIILGIVASIAVGVFSSTLRGGNKSNSINEIRQNGNYAVSQMSKMIEYAQELEGVCDSSSQDCFDNTPKIPPIYSTACSNINAKYTDIKIKNFDGGETVFSCTGTTIASRSADSASPESLVNTAIMTVSNCIFTCTRSSDAVSPTIGISFKLSANNGSLAENKADIDFETSVKPRNNPESP